MHIVLGIVLLWVGIRLMADCLPYRKPVVRDERSMEDEAQKIEAFLRYVEKERERRFAALFPHATRHRV